MKKIVAIISTMYTGGAQKNLLYYLSCLEQQGHSITLVSLKKSNEYTIPPGIKLMSILEENTPLMPNIFMVMQQLTKISQGADTVIGFMDYITNYLAYIVSKIHNTKLILSSRSYLKKNIEQFDSLKEINYNLTQLIYADAHIIVQSPFIKKELQKFLHLKNPSIHILPNYIETKQAKKSTKKIFQKNKVFIAVARLTREKRVDIIIKAFNRILKKEIVNVKLLIVGSGNEENSLKKLVKKLNLEKNIHFTKETTKTLSLIKSSHASILASEYEGLSNVILETMSQKTLIIASDIGANKAVICHKKTGLLFQTNSIKDLSKQMLFSLQNEKKYKTISKNGYKYIKKYSQQDISAKLGEIV